MSHIKKTLESIEKKDIKNAKESFNKAILEKIKQKLKIRKKQIQKEVFKD